MNKKTVRDADLSGKKVLVRVDFNVPMDGGTISDPSRITATLPTLRYLIDQGARLILMSHFGDPKERSAEFSLAPVAEYLGTQLGTTVPFASDCVGPEAQRVADAVQPGQVALLENTRFHKGEKKNDPEFAGQLAALADVYVNDAFGASHRPHASSEGVAHLLPAYAGLLMEKEISILENALENPTRPFVVILGGSKVSDKIQMIDNVLPRVDKILIGGGMAYTFLKAQGKEIGKSRLEADKLDFARELIERAQADGKRLVLPVDTLVAPGIDSAAGFSIVSVDQMPVDQLGPDIGPETVELFARELEGAGTVIWNGPMGVFETPGFDQGTRGVAEALAKVQAAGGDVIVGGGDTGAAVREMGFADQMGHISTGGGATLEFLGGLPLPGYEVLPVREG